MKNSQYLRAENCAPSLEDRMSRSLLLSIGYRLEKTPMTLGHSQLTLGSTYGTQFDLTWGGQPYADRRLVKFISFIQIGIGPWRAIKSSTLFLCALFAGQQKLRSRFTDRFQNSHFRNSVFGKKHFRWMNRVQRVRPHDSRTLIIALRFDAAPSSIVEIGFSSTLNEFIITFSLVFLLFVR